jgi:hypothetical protein
MCGFDTLWRFGAYISNLPTYRFVGLIIGPRLASGIASKHHSGIAISVKMTSICLISHLSGSF